MQVHGTIASFSGGDAGVAMLSGFIRSMVGTYGMDNNWGNVETIGSAMLMGGVSSELSGGEFWRGAAIGGIVAGANHVAHRVGASAEEKVREKRQQKRGCPNCGLADYLRNSPFFGYGAGAVVNPFYNAEAIFSDMGVILSGAGKDAGSFFILTGLDKGKFISYSEIAGGVAPEMGGGVSVSWSYFRGNNPGWIIGTSLQGGGGLSTPLSIGYNEGIIYDK